MITNLNRSFWLRFQICYKWLIFEKGISLLSISQVLVTPRNFLLLVERSGNGWIHVLNGGLHVRHENSISEKVKMHVFRNVIKRIYGLSPPFTISKDCKQMCLVWHLRHRIWYCFDNYFTYFVPVFKYCYSDSRNLWIVMRAGGLAL